MSPLKTTDIVFFPAVSISSCNLLLVVKTKAAFCICLFDKGFSKTVDLPTPLIEKVVSHPVRAYRDRSLV